MNFSFLLDKLAWMVFRFSTVIFLLGIIGNALLWTRRARLGRSLVGIAIGALAAALLLPFHQWLLLPLENRFPQVSELPARVAGIAVLGGAVDTLLTERHGVPALNDAAERMTTFVMLARRYPEARLAFTGGSGLLVPSPISEADVARALFEQLGLGRPVIYEAQSRTTWENAVMLRDMVHPLPGETWILLTSAFHMPRAVGAFRAAGWTVLPWPVGYKSDSPTRLRLDQGLPEHLQIIDMAEHEWLGLLQYYLLGRTDTLFPAPDAAGRLDPIRQVPH